MDFHRAFFPRCGFDNSARFGLFFAGDFFKGQALAEHRRTRFDKPLRVGLLAVVEPIDLFIKVAIKMERFDGNVGALEGDCAELDTKPITCTYYAAWPSFYSSLSGTGGRRSLLASRPWFRGWSTGYETACFREGLPGHGNKLAVR